MSGIPSDVDAINPDSPTEGGGTLICFSHLRWNFVYQRPQHLMSRFARDRKVIVWEEPIHDAPSATLDTHVCDCSGVTILTPHLPAVEGRFLLIARSFDPQRIDPAIRRDRSSAGTIRR